MRNLYYKKLFTILIAMVVLLHSFSYAKHSDPFEGEVKAPVAENKNNISEATIIAELPYGSYQPVGPAIEKKSNPEYDSVNNYIIDLNTLDTRIKYFSPTYTNIKSGAESSYWMAFYARGGNDTLVYDYKYYTEEIHDIMMLYKDDMNGYILQRNLLNKSDPDFEKKYKDLTIKIITYQTMYGTAKSSYGITNATITKTKTMLGLNRALYNIDNVDNNNKVAFARRSVTKAISSVVLTYLQLVDYTDILEKQTNLYYDMYLLKKKNYELGLATAIDVTSSLETYEKTKNTFKSTETTLKNVKEQVAINLGYKISDMDKLVFKEPEPDLNYIASIDFEADKNRAYTSNSAYTSIKISDKDKKYPQSTGEDIFNRRQEYMSSVISAEFENIYNNLIAKKLSYDSSLLLKEICEIEDIGNKRKFDNDLVSELEFKGLELQNLSNKLQVKVAKYNLINAINEYYYAALGDITIS